MFYDTLKNVCSTNNTTVSGLVKELGLSTSKVTAWKNGSIPKADTVAKIADYLDVSVDYLLGRTDSPTAINSHNTVNGSNNIIGNGNNTESKLSDQESALIDIFNKLDVVSQAKLLVYATELEKEKN